MLIANLFALYNSCIYSLKIHHVSCRQYIIADTGTMSAWGLIYDDASPQCDIWTKIANNDGSSMII